MADGERRLVPIEEAIARIGEGEYVHTFMSPRGGMLLGCDHERDGIIEAMRTKGVEEAGPSACAMGHTLVIVDYIEGAPLFIEAYPREVADGNQAATEVSASTVGARAQE